MGGKDFCCVINCHNGRLKNQRVGEKTVFCAFPMGKSAKACRRRNLWLKAIRRDNFVPTASTRVCGRHFVSGFQINDPSSVDYVPSLNLGYEKSVRTRLTVTSRRTNYTAVSNVLAMTGEKERRQLSGLLAPDIGAEVTLGKEPTDRPIPLPDIKENTEASTSDHSYSRLSTGILVVKSTASQTPENYNEEISRLKKEITDLSQIIKEQADVIKEQEKEIQSLKHKIKPDFHPDVLLTSNEAVQFYTGFATRSAYDIFSKYIAERAQLMHYWDGENKDYDKQRHLTGKPRCISREVEFMAVMMRLKVGLFLHDISARMGISRSQFCRMFTSWIRLLRLEMEAIHRFPTRFEVRHFMPPDCLKYQNLRAIIDCTEFFIETPSSLTAQRETWSAYKSHNTLKVLVACTPDGVLSYISRVYGGAASDKFITANCGFLDHLECGDHILADKGFDIQDAVMAKGAFLNLPPFRTPGLPQFTEEEVQATKLIAEARIRVECLIGRIKIYHILDGALPLSLYSVAEDIIHTCAYLTKFQSPVLAQLNQNFDSISTCGNPICRSPEESLISSNPQS